MGRENFGFRRRLLTAHCVLIGVALLLGTTPAVVWYGREGLWKIAIHERLIALTIVMMLDQSIRLLSVRVSEDGIRLRGLVGKTAIQWRDVKQLSVLRGRFILQSDRARISLLMLHYERHKDLLRFMLGRVSSEPGPLASDTFRPPSAPSGASPPDR